MTSDQTATKEQHAAFAQVGSTYYPIFVAVFTALVIISNVTATKGVAFGPIIGNWSIITDGGFIVFPLTYVIGDVLSEVYGFKAARRAIFLGFAMNGLAALTFTSRSRLRAAGRSARNVGSPREMRSCARYCARSDPKPRAEADLAGRSAAH